MSFFKPQFMQPWIDAYKKGGIKELLSQHGWKVIIGFFLFFLQFWQYQGKRGPQVY